MRVINSLTKDAYVKKSSHLIIFNRPHKRMLTINKVMRATMTRQTLETT